jgi:hypothetical protein
MRCSATVNSSGGSDGRYVVAVIGPQAQKYGPIIAASPDLLAACEDALTYLENDRLTMSDLSLAERLRAAIQRARVEV